MSNTIVVGQFVSASRWNDSVIKMNASSSNPSDPVMWEIYMNTGGGSVEIRQWDGSSWDQITMPVNTTTNNFHLTTRYISYDGSASTGFTLDASNNVEITENLEVAGSIFNTDKFILGSPNTQTISGGVITMNSAITKVDTQGGAGTDDLDTINGGQQGSIIQLQTVDNARDVVVKDNTGNLFLNGGADFNMAGVNFRIWLIYDSTASKWFEIARLTP